MTPMAGDPMGRTMPSAGVSLSTTPPMLSSLFGSNPVPSYSVHHPKYGAPSSTQGTSLYQLSRSLGMSQPGPTRPTLGPWEAAPYLGSGMVQPTSMGGIPPLGHKIFPSCVGAGMVQSSSMGGTPPMAPQSTPPYLGVGMAQPSSVGGKPQAGVVHLGGSTPLAGGGVSLQSQLFSGTGSGETNQGNDSLNVCIH